MAGKRNDMFDFFDPSRAKGPKKGPDVGRDVTDEVAGGDVTQPGRPVMKVNTFSVFLLQTGRL